MEEKREGQGWGGTWKRRGATIWGGQRGIGEDGGHWDKRGDGGDTRMGSNGEMGGGGCIAPLLLSPAPHPNHAHPPPSPAPPPFTPTQRGLAQTTPPRQKPRPLFAGKPRPLRPKPRPLTSSTWAWVCCSRRLLVRLGGGAGGPPPSPPPAGGGAAGAAGADLETGWGGWGAGSKVTEPRPFPPPTPPPPFSPPTPAGIKAANSPGHVVWEGGGGGVLCPPL